MGRAAGLIDAEKCLQLHQNLPSGRLSNGITASSCTFSPNCARTGCLFRAPCRSARRVSATCGRQSRSIWTARRSRTDVFMQTAPTLTQIGKHICKASEASRSLRRVSGRNTTLWCPRTPHPRMSAASGSRSRPFSTDCKRKRTSSPLPTSAPAPVCSFTSSPPLPSPL